MQETKTNARVATGWQKNKKYAIRNAAAVQYCSLLEENPDALRLGSTGELSWKQEP
jgi:hypothetical protein